MDSHATSSSPDEIIEPGLTPTHVRELYLVSQIPRVAQKKRAKRETLVPFRSPRNALSCNNTKISSKTTLAPVPGFESGFNWNPAQA